MLESEAHINFSGDFVPGTGEGKIFSPSPKKCSDYYPFGLQMPGRSSNTGNPNDNYKYTGHERDDEANLNIDYMGARYYDPGLGRFYSIDPLGALYPNVSPYVYALNNPVYYTDPTGRCPEGYDEGDVWDPGDGSGPTLCGPTIEVTATQLPMQITIQRARPDHYAATVTALPTLGRVSRVPVAGQVVAGGVLLGLMADASYKAITFKDSETFEMMLPATTTLDDILDGATPGRETKGKTKQYDKPGGQVQADQDFDDLPLGGVVNIPGVGRVGTLPDGRKVVVRNKDHSSGGDPTLEVQDGNKRIKIRYE